ncbi:MAG: UDP-N-acetylglucosamine 2-epimerase [Phycisphaerales bacterium]
MPKHSTSTPSRRVLVVTGSRSEFGLLRPVMAAVKKQKGLTLQVAVAGEHLLGPALTWHEVAKAFRIDAKVPMQKPGDKGRAAHAAACGRGVEGFAKSIKKLKPDWVVVLGDRIEAFAAASAASIAGVAVCHIHGGDRAEGIADEAMRHAITKLAHLHCAATKLSAERIVKMGEHKRAVHVTGSPAIDGLSKIKPLSRSELSKLGNPAQVLLLHPSGLSDQIEHDIAFTLMDLATLTGNTLVIAPNSDPGSEVIRKEWRFSAKHYPHVQYVDHLPRGTFLSLLQHFAEPAPAAPISGVLMGNSSAGLIEAGGARRTRHQRRSASIRA